MNLSLPKRQTWLVHALQGLAFWIGHRHSLFKGYPLSEGALMAEACNLIQANLPHNLILLPECMYRNLVADGSIVLGVAPQARADLVICDAMAKAVGREGDLSAHTKFVFEVKRGNASTRTINEDLVRLHSFLRVATAETRCFLLVVGESMAPKNLVKDGKAALGKRPITRTDGHYRVRRVVKASASFAGKESAHYACLVEVFLAGQKPAAI